MATPSTFCYVPNGMRSSAERFLGKALKAAHNQMPQVMNVDKNPAYPNATEQIKADNTLPKKTKLRQNKYLNNVVEQDHRFIKRLTNPARGFHSFNTARAFIERI